MATSLSQSEVDALLSGLETGVSRPESEEVAAEPSVDLPYTELIRKLEVTLCSHLTSELEHSLRGRCEVRLASFSSSICAEVLSSLDARCVAVVESRQLGSHSLVAMNSGAVFPMIDCLLGGGSSTVAAPIPERQLTDIELKLIARCLNSIVAALQQAWSEYQPAEFQVAHVEGRIPVAELISPREPVVTLQLDLAVNGLTGQSTLVLPERAILDLARKSGLATTLPDAMPSDAPVTVDESHSHADIRVQLTSFDISVETLSSLSVGDILPLDAESKLSVATIFVDGSPAFTGTPGIHAGRKAVRIEAERPSRPVEESVITEK